MKPKSDAYNSSVSRSLIYLLLVLAGILIILFCSLIQHVQAPQKGEYYYSSFFRNNFTLLAKILFATAGFFAGYFYKLNPWLSGMCFMAVFPLVSIIEGIVYKGSHNLIPVEFVFHFWLALPVIIAVYIGRFVYHRFKRRKETFIN